MFWGARSAPPACTNDISQPRDLVVANMNYLGKPTQGKGFAVVTLTKPKSGPDLARTDRCISLSLRDRTKKAEPLTRAPRRAQRVQDRPRRRRRSGRSCATERSEGAPVLAQRPAALARSSCKLCEAQRAEHRLWTGLLSPPLALVLLRALLRCARRASRPRERPRPCRAPPLLPGVQMHIANAVATKTYDEATGTAEATVLDFARSAGDVVRSFVASDDADTVARIWRTAGRASIRFDDRPPFS